MLVTIADAATKYCPFKFVLDRADPNRFCSNLFCMAWRKAPAIPTTHEEMGYCGLAGYQKND